MADLNSVKNVFQQVGTVESAPTGFYYATALGDSKDGVVRVQMDDEQYVQAYLQEDEVEVYMDEDMEDSLDTYDDELDESEEDDVDEEYDDTDNDDASDEVDEEG